MDEFELFYLEFIAWVFFLWQKFSFVIEFWDDSKQDLINFCVNMPLILMDHIKHSGENLKKWVMKMKLVQNWGILLKRSLSTEKLKSDSP